MGLPSPIFATPKELVTEKRPASVSAVYRISFGVFGDIGVYRFKSKLRGEKYNLVADAKIETKVLDYSAEMRSSGSLVASQLKPEKHMFRFKQNPLIGKKKRSTLNMAFDEDSPSKHVIPVVERDLQDVLDPLSAIMALSLDNKNEVCRRTLSVFDGKRRFDLIFKPKRGASRNVVCLVHFAPISGHRRDEDRSVITGNAEVVLRRVPKANIVIPWRITVPTIAGNAVLMSDQVVVTMPDSKRIAFRR
jgi:hypothetical protein